MNKSDFYYDLPEELIAQHPATPRDHSRMLVYNLDNNGIVHKHFYDVVDYLRSGDVLVVNDTKVIPARMFCHRDKLQESIEILLLKRVDAKRWEVIAKPARKLKIGTKIVVNDELSGVIASIGEQGIRVVEFAYDGVFEEILDRVGNMPLPPYITEKLLDKSRYQTVYCNELGSAAAPTAGLHFTDELLYKITAMGVQVAKVLLHVGLGTFRPVKEDNILDHKMHSEYCRIDAQNAEIINRAKAEGRRVICVGTTSVRTVESLADKDGNIKDGSMDTQIFIYPPYKFKIVDGLITNFHLPESTLLMLVSALMGRENTLNMYKIAVQEKYRFFSFGDATLLIKD